MNLNEIAKSVRTIDDFPKKGIHFKDITTAVKQPDVFREIIKRLAKNVSTEKIDTVIGVEARGFIFGAALAYELGCGFIPVRKSGKLPSTSIVEEYALEYGTDKLEMHSDAILPRQKVLIIDDLLATGGTSAAAAKLAQRLGAQVASFAFFVEIADLGGRKKLEKIAPVYSILTCND